MLVRFDGWMKQAKYVPHVFDLSQGDLVISAGAAEYSAYLAKVPAPDTAPVGAYASQDSGKSWTKLKGEIIVVTSAPTDHGIVVDNDAPYGNLTLTLDGITTTGMLQLSPKGNAAILIKGSVTTGAIHSGAALTISSVQDGQSHTLTVNNPSGFGISAGGDIDIHDLTDLQVNAGKEDMYSEKGTITGNNTVASADAI